MNSPPGPEAERPHRAGHVAIVGRPNVGKSTLLNRLVGCKLSITSSKPQTTRQRLTGIVTRPRAQLVFVDTPGYLAGRRAALHRMMNRAVTASLEAVDAVVWVVEALRDDERDRAVGALLPERVPAVLAINKIDRVKDKALLLPFIERLAQWGDFAAVIPLSAARGTQVERLLEVLAGLMPEGPPLHGADEITTASERFLAAELLREKLFRLLGEELPYASAVEIEAFSERRGVRHVRAAIVVEKEGQKAIVIGAQGAKLKAVASQARRDMERLFGGRVFLETWVRVRRGWAGSESALRRLGYDT